MEYPQSEIVDLATGQIRVSWRRSARARRLSLRIDPCGGFVIVTLPPRATRRSGLNLVSDNADWLRSNLDALPRRLILKDGVSVPVNGIPHRINQTSAERASASIEDAEIRVAGDAASCGRQVTDLLRSEAGRSLGALVMAKAGQSGLRPGRVTIKDTRTRWGSCAANGNLGFSWRLIMAPPEIQDYAVAHELAHLRHMNHGELFWRLVAELTTHQEAARSWLHASGPILLRVG